MYICIYIYIIYIYIYYIMLYAYKYYIHRNDFNGNSCTCGICVSCHEDTYIALYIGYIVFKFL